MVLLAGMASAPAGNFHLNEASLSGQGQEEKKDVARY